MHKSWSGPVLSPQNFLLSALQLTRLGHGSPARPQVRGSKGEREREGGRKKERERERGEVFQIVYTHMHVCFDAVRLCVVLMPGLLCTLQVPIHCQKEVERSTPSTARCHLKTTTCINWSSSGRRLLPCLRTAPPTMPLSVSAWCWGRGGAWLTLCGTRCTSTSGALLAADDKWPPGFTWKTSESCSYWQQRSKSQAC